MNERTYSGGVARLRSPERVERLEVTRVTELTLAGLDHPRTMLDVGTGSALFAGQFASAGLRVSGVDISTEMLAAARDFVPGGDFREGKAEALPYPDASFDIVFMGLLLHETDDLALALREAHRVCTRRAAVLEWPHVEAEFGPPLAHRLQEAAVTKALQAAGFKRTATHALKHLVLYTANK